MSFLRRCAVGLLALASCNTFACGSGSSSIPEESTSERKGPPGEPSPDNATAAGIVATKVVLVFGGEVLPALKERIVSIVKSSSGVTTTVEEWKTPATMPTGLTATTLVLSFGDTAVTRSVIPAQDVTALGSEGFVLRSGKVGVAPMLAALGNASTQMPKAGGSGTGFGAYALLEEIGFAFLHPLAPTLPTSIAIPTATVNRSEKPYWPVRGWHLHTMHPLELTDLLQGWGPGGPNDEAGWAAMLPEWDRFLEWVIANKQNRVEWILLWAQSWSDFADGPVRIQRFKKLVDRAHAFGVAVGIDAPIALQQQHGYTLVRTTGDLTSELSQIRSRIDYLMAAGFDFIGTESGSTEFSHPDVKRMLAWMNEVATYSRSKYNASSIIKVHCSTGQTADGFADPAAKGKDINFNFLPHYADPKLGVLPHTVEHYGLMDPAPTYGNTNFAYMRDFIQLEAGSRETIWYPETAYWVSFDINVPLFLPIYANRRVSDLRLLADDEAKGKMGRGAKAGSRMDGQFVFSSGWEWGYWLNDVVAARAAWDPKRASSTDRDALIASLAPVVRPFSTAASEVATVIADIADAQYSLLIKGTVNGKDPSDIVMRNGQAYLQGYDATADLADLARNMGISASPQTQPQRLGLVDLRNPLHGGPSYSRELGPLLTAMDTTFGTLADKLAGLSSRIPANALPLYADLVDSMRMTALRAKQVHGLYDYVNGFPIPANATRQARLKVAQGALDQAAAVVKGREAQYRVPADRIAAWRSNPTAYPFTYLWTARSLYFWWRDEGKAIDAPVNPCYLNIENPVEVGFGEGTFADAAQGIATAIPNSVTECLAAPKTEPKYPQDQLRKK